MITPGLVKRALVRGAQWRLLLISSLLLLVPTAAAVLPIARFLGEQFDFSPRWKELTPRLDSAAFFDLVKQVSQKEAGAQLSPGLQLGFLLTLLLAPLLAGAALTAAGRDEPPRLRALFSGAAALYGRLLRMEAMSLIPYGLASGAAAGLGAWQGKLADKSITEAQVTSTGRWFNGATLLLFVLATLLVDAGRAWLVAQPERRSAFFAFGAGVKLAVRRPLTALWITVASSLCGLGLAAAVLVLRLQITQSGAGSVLLALVLSLLAGALVSYAHAARLCGLVELAQADLADRTRSAPFEMEPPRTSPPPAKPAPVTAPVDYRPAAEPEVEPALDDPSAALAVALAPAAPVAPSAAPVFTELATPDPSLPAPFLESPHAGPPPAAADAAAAPTETKPPAEPGPAAGSGGGA